MRTHRLPALVFLVPVLLSIGVGAACRSKAPAAPPPEREAVAPAEPAATLPDRVTLTAAAIAEAGIQTWEVKLVDLTHLLVLNGEVDHDENRVVSVAANVRGRITRMPVDLGGRVARGQAVAELESVELGRAREEFIRELVALRAATRVYERAKTLVAGKAISAGEFQARENDYLARQASSQAAERALHLLGDADAEIARLRSTTEAGGTLPTSDAPRLALRAPFGGRVVERKATAGALIDALQPVVTIADLSSVWVFLKAYEKDLALISLGLPVTIRAEAYPRESFRGRLDFLDSLVDPATRTMRVRATVANPNERLRPGMFVKGQVDIPRPQAEAHPTLAVPQSALQTLDAHQTVFVQASPGVFVRRVVEIGHTFEGMTEILGGVKPGEVIVTEGSFVLKSEFAKALLAEED